MLKVIEDPILAHPAQRVGVSLPSVATLVAGGAVL